MTRISTSCFTVFINERKISDKKGGWEERVRGSGCWLAAISARPDRLYQKNTNHTSVKCYRQNRIRQVELVGDIFRLPRTINAIGFFHFPVLLKMRPIHDSPR
jgi:hypothetical protein